MLKKVKEWYKKNEELIAALTTVAACITTTGTVVYLCEENKWKTALLKVYLEHDPFFNKN